MGDRSESESEKALKRFERGNVLTEIFWMSGND